MTGDWEAWMRFFLRGALVTANQAVSTAKKVLQMFDEDRAKVEKLGIASGSALRLYLLLQKQLTIAPSKVDGKNLQMSNPTLHSAINRLVKLRILKEMTGKTRHQVFVYARYSDILNETD